MTGTNELQDERTRLVLVAKRLIEERGDLVSRSALATGAGVPRARVEATFPAEDDLLDAIVEHWFAEHAAIMEEVVASDLPANRKMYEFFGRRFLLNRARFRADPAAFKIYCDLGAAHFERLRSYIDLADHYLCEIIAQAQHEGVFEGLSIAEALSCINQMVAAYTMTDLLVYLDDRLSEEKLARIVDTLFAGLSAADGGAAGVKGLRAA